MSYQDEFLSQWKSFISIVESAVIRQIKANKEVSIDEINKVIFDEREKWFSSTQYQCIWLNKIKLINVNTYKEIVNILRGIKISKVQAISAPSFIPYLLIAMVIGVGSYFLTSYLKLAPWQIWGSTIVAPLFIGGTLFAVWKDKNISKKMNGRNLYLSQLDKPKDELLKRCEILDSKK